MKDFMANITPIFIIFLLLLLFLLPIFLILCFVTGSIGEALYGSVYQIFFIIFIFLIYIIYNAYKNRKESQAALLCHQTDLFILLFIGFVLFAIFYPNFCKAKRCGQLEECKSNLKNLAAGMELYFHDNKHHYPDDMDKIRLYFKKFPLCPTRRERDDSLFNKIFLPEDNSPHYLYKVSGNFDNFTIMCNTGNIHSKMTEVTNTGCWPQYTSKKGLLLSPDIPAGK